MAERNTREAAAAAAINHIHSLPVERIFNLHGPAYGRLILFLSISICFCFYFFPLLFSPFNAPVAHCNNNNLNKISFNVYEIMFSDQGHFYNFVIFVFVLNTILKRFVDENFLMRSF